MGNADERVKGETGKGWVQQKKREHKGRRKKEKEERRGEEEEGKEAEEETGKGET